MKNVFTKASLEIQVYREKLPDILLRAKPVVTQSGTCPDASLLYFKY